MPVTWFVLLDKYGQVVQANNGALIRFNLDMNDTIDNFETGITGMKEFASIYGTYRMEHMGILSKPGIEIPVSIFVNSIDLRVPTTR